MNITDMIAREPASMVDLLDLFDAFLERIPSPLYKARDLIDHQFQCTSGPILAHLITPVNEADVMKKRLAQIRARQADASQVTISLTDAECRKLDTAIPDLIGILVSTKQALMMLAETIGDDQSDCFNAHDVAATLRLVCRALHSAEMVEIPPVEQFERTLRRAVSARLEAERRSALGEEDEVK